MSTTEERLANRNAAIRRILEPELAELDGKLEELETRYEALKAERTTLQAERNDTVAMLRRVDPDNPAYAPKQYMAKKPKPGPRRSQWGITEEKVTAMESYLHTHAGANGLAEGFTVGSLIRRDDYIAELGWAGQTARYAIAALLDRGVLRLDSVNQKTQAKTYKLTEAS
jgi:hypothetical protein